MLKKQKIDITYPRKCPQCNYEANNPASYSYHKKTHQPIPQDTKCHFGCGQNATHTNTGGKHTCQKKYQQCPSYLEQLAERSKKSWKDDNNRKEQTKETFLKHCAGNKEVIQKMKETKRERYNTITPDEFKEYKKYARKVRAGAQRWARENGYEVGQQTYHVDHKLSVKDAWRENLPLGVVNHPANLQILEAKKNSAKGSKSILTKEKLLELIKKPYALT